MSESPIITPSPAPSGGPGADGMPPPSPMPQGAPSGGAGLAVMMPGLFIMAFGVLIIAKPELIRWVFGGFLIFVGLVAIVAARKVSRARARMANLKQQFQGFGGGFPGM